MKPSVGRIVHYTSYGTPGGEYTSQCRAAIITEITECDAHTECVGLFVANPDGLFLNHHIPHNETSQQRGGTWHWPERVE
jgi:hypothetical protein